MKDLKNYNHIKDSLNAYAFIVKNKFNNKNINEKYKSNINLNFTRITLIIIYKLF